MLVPRWEFATEPFKVRSVLHDPAVDGRAIDRSVTLLHQLFQLAIAQRVGHQRTQVRILSFSQWTPLKLTMRSLPLMEPASQKEIIPQMARERKFATNRARAAARDAGRG